MKRLFNLFAIGLLLAACDMEQQEPQVKVQSTYSVECASYDFTDENGIATKSVIGVDKSGSDGSQKVSNWNIWVYDHSTGNIVNNGGKNIYDETMKTFFRQTSGIDGDLLFPDENGHYDIYILTNVEQITSVPATASAAAAYNYTFQNYNSFKPENGGFPMATVYSNFCPATAASHTFMVKRLVSKYDVVIVNDIPDSDFTLSSVKLKQGAKKINPFQENSKISLGTEAGEDYDIFSAAELVKKDAVTYTGELYMLENNQGQVFNSSVSTDKERIPDNMINPQNGELCTFVEFAGNIAMKDGHGQNNIKFRHYFGSGRNAGVMRNINTTVTLTLKTCPNDSDEDWRIVPEDPYDTRTVVFNPNPVEIVADGSWYDVTVTPKAGDPLVLNNYIEYRLECPDASSASLSFDGVTMGSTVSGQKTLRIKSNYSGSTPTTVKLYAYVTEKESYVSCLDINIGVQSPDVPIPYTNNAPTYDWQFGSIDLTDAISSTKTVTVKLVNGNGMAKNNSEKVLNNSTKVSFNDNSGHHYYYVPSSKTLYYCSTNGSAGSSAGRYSIVLSQEGSQSVTITPDTKKVYYTVDYDYTGSATSPTITIDETGDDIRIPIIYYDPTTGRTYNHSTFFVPYPLKSNFSDFNNRDDRESYMDYMDDDGGGKFGYAVDDEYDDMAPGYITIYGLHPGQGYVDLNSGDGMWACQDLHLQVKIEEVETGLVELGEFHSEFAMRPDDNRYLTVGSIPTSAVLRHVSNGTIPSSFSAAATAWTNASSTSDYLKNISVYSTGKLKFEEPGKNRTGWYACGSYVGKLSKTNPHTSQSYNTYYTFQIYQDVPIGIGVAFEQGTGSSTGTTFNWKSNRIKVYPVPFMRAWNKEYNMLSRIQQYFPQIYAKFYYSDETRYVYQQTLPVPQPEMSDRDYNGVYVYGDNDWFQISGTWINKTLGQWNVTSGSDTEYRVSDGLTSNGAFRAPKPLFEIALSSSGYFDNIILINDDNASVSNSIGGGWWYFYLEPSVERTNSSSVVHEYAFPIEQFYSDWSNY